MLRGCTPQQALISKSPIFTTEISSFVLGNALLSVNDFNSFLVGIRNSTVKPSDITSLAYFSASLTCSSVRVPSISTVLISVPRCIAKVLALKSL